MISVRIITPNGLYMSMDVDSITGVSVDGQFTLLPKHMPIVAMLTTSKLILREQGNTHDYAISGGLLHLLDDHINLLVDTIESRDEIDLSRALEAKARYEESLEEHRDEHERRVTETNLKRTINRINVKQG